MNNVRRKRVRKCIETLQSVPDMINDLADEEEQAFNCLPEGLQASVHGEKMQEAAENLYEAAEMFDEAINALESALK